MSSYREQRSIYPPAKIHIQEMLQKKTRHATVHHHGSENADSPPTNNDSEKRNSVGGPD